MKFTARIFALIALLALVASAPVLAQSTPPQNPPAPPPTKPGTPAQPGATGTSLPDQPAAPPVNKEEEDAYKVFFETKDNALTVKLGDEFLQKFPSSRYLETVYARLSRSYLTLNQEEKMFSNGEKALTLNPDNVDILVLMSWAIPRRLDTKALDASQKLAKAEQFSKRAQEILAVLPKPNHLTEEEFIKSKNESLSRAHSGLGLVYFHRGRMAEAAAEFEQATKVIPDPDPVDFYLSGLALSRLNKFTESAEAFGRCADAPSAVQTACKQNQAEAKKQAAAKPATPAPPKP